MLCFLSFFVKIFKNKIVSNFHGNLFLLFIAIYYSFLVEPFADEAEMQRALLVANNTNVVLAGISFDSSVEDIDQEEMIIPQNLQVI